MFAFTVRFPEYGQNPQPTTTPKRLWCVARAVGFGWYFDRVSVAIASGKHPVSIPNLEVKPASADGTATGRSWESRTPPDIHTVKGHPHGWPLMCFQGKSPAQPLPYSSAAHLWLRMHS